MTVSGTGHYRDAVTYRDASATRPATDGFVIEDGHWGLCGRACTL